MNFDDLEQFNIEIIKNKNSFEKIRVEASKLYDLLDLLKNNAQFEFERLNTIVAIDLMNYSAQEVPLDEFELIYDLHSIKTGDMVRISVILDRNSPKISSVVDIYKSAYFDECEIFDLFGIKFDKNPDLKRLLMPKGWVGHPLRKDYKQSDERLAWND